jgi:hypothetical protein
MSSCDAVAKGLTDLCRTGKFHEAMQAYYSPDIVSTEPMGENPTVKGMEAVAEKGQ